MTAPNDNRNHGHPIDGLGPYVIDGHGCCTPPESNPTNEESE